VLTNAQCGATLGILEEHREWQRQPLTAPGKSKREARRAESAQSLVPTLSTVFDWTLRPQPVPSRAGIASNASGNIALLSVGGLLFGRKLSRKPSASARSVNDSEPAQDSGSRGASCRAGRSFRSDQGTSDLIITV